MIINDREHYGSADKWLAAIKEDEAWLIKWKELENATPADNKRLRKNAIDKMGEEVFHGPWDTYHDVEKACQDLWDSGFSLSMMKHKVVGMLMMEWLEQHSKTENTKKPAEKVEKPRETMTFKCGKNVLEGHLTLLFNKLTQEKWIEGFEVNFKALFSGKKDKDCELTWISSFGKGTLVWLFKTLATEELIVVPNGYTIPAILEGHFKDKKGQWLRGLDKGDNPNKRAKTTFIECVKLLKINPNGRFDEQNEDFQLRYDPFDHQDMNLHKK